MSRRAEDETTVNGSYSVTVPAVIRRVAGIEAGDELRWTVDEDGTIAVEPVDKRYGAFSELDPVDTGEETHAAEDHDLVADERWCHGPSSTRTCSSRPDCRGIRITTARGG
ncbi:AbrB family transcriptional regulator [Halobacteriales archaeon QS_5_70_15]|nr:MAG: AbrB family transcriptional regulator [Halobacteriales archaeon QS_5_70_15]